VQQGLLALQAQQNTVIFLLFTTAQQCPNIYFYPPCPLTLRPFGR
jgi:hypothetical protein